jgi:uncharacterized membrane protein YfcA
MSLDPELLRALVICLTALGASALTFFSGFGLGTLLMPAFAVFYPIDVAVASTAVVHFLNSLFKLTLVGRHANRTAVLKFGLPAIAAALVGAWLLAGLSEAAALGTWSAFGLAGTILPAKLAVGILLLTLTIFELSPAGTSWRMPPSYLPLGGVLSGFLGGISGMQGALRSAFLIRLGLSKEAFIGTGVVVAALVDVSRLSVYSGTVAQQHAGIDFGLLTAAVAAAFLGAWLGNRYLRKVTLDTVQRIVGIMLIVVGIGLAVGIL